MNRIEQMVNLTHQGWNMSRIARHYNITRQAVSQLLKKAANQGFTVHKIFKTKHNNHPNYKIILKPEKTHTCNVCNQNFTSKYKRKTCSKKCYTQLVAGGEWSKVQTVTLNCNFCHKDFERTKHMFKMNNKNTKNHYCSRDCYENRLRNSQCPPSLPIQVS